MIIVNKNIIYNIIIYIFYYDNTPARFGLLSLASAMFFMCLMIEPANRYKRTVCIEESD